MEVILFDLYKLIKSSGGYEIITIEDGWNDIAMRFGFPEDYGEAFTKLYIDYLMHPLEYYAFAQKRFGTLSSNKNLKIGSLPDKVLDKPEGPVGHGVGTSEGGLTKGNGHEDRNATLAPVQIKSCKELEVEESEDELPSIEGYYSEDDKDPNVNSDDNEDFVILL